jgi:hypothetical protein
MTRLGCSEEDTQQKEESPGVVTNDEPVVFAMVYPVSIDDRSLARFHKDRLKSRELSVCRAFFCSYRQMYRKVVRPQLNADPARRYRGYLWAPCGEIRDIIATPRPKQPPHAIGAFCVIDDGDLRFPAHSRLGYCAPTPDFWSRNDREAARGDLSLRFHVRGIHQAPSSPPFRLRRIEMHQILLIERALRKALRRAARTRRRAP